MSLQGFDTPASDKMPWAAAQGRMGGLSSGRRRDILRVRLVLMICSGEVAGARSRGGPRTYGAIAGIIIEIGRPI